MKKIKILYIGMSSNIGGIEKYLINVYRNIDKSKFDINFLSFNNEKLCFYDEIKNNIIYITHRNKNYFKFIKELKEILRHGNYDIIHINLVEFSFFEPIIYAKKYTNAKIIIHSHIAKFKLPSIKTKIINCIGKKMVMKNDKYYFKAACSNLAGDYMFSDFENKEYKVLNNGINIEEFKFDQEKRKQIREELGIEENCILLGNIGRMVYQKNQTYLIELLDKLVHERQKDYKLLIIGKGPLRKNIVNLAKEKNVYERLVIMQDIDNVYDYMSAMDIFVLPSNFEGLAIVLVEAQTAGLKCYASEKGISEEANITENVIFIDLEDKEKWIEQIESANYKDRNVDKEKLKEYDVKNTVKNLEEYYEEIVKE